MSDSQLVSNFSSKQWCKLIEQVPLFNELAEQESKLLQQAIGLSDFVYNTCLRTPQLVFELFDGKGVYCKTTPAYADLLSALVVNCQSEADLHKKLRQFRMIEMVRIAVGDMVLQLPLAQSLQRLSMLAEALILSARDWLVEFHQASWGLPYSYQGKQQALLVFAMGKLGGQELNFSSDIDLIFTYPETGCTKGGRRELDNQEYFTRLGQKLIAALHQQTADGFVYRVDMRLRPFGDSGPLVLSFNALEDYYQEQGRDWERYAMLKARLLGSSEFHSQLETMLKPFVFRRYIDFSVIDSLRRMKSMIAQEVRRKQLSNNIKLGAGGIREIEFIVQVFQLIRGGRQPQLQERHVLSVLPQLELAGELSADSAKVLEQAYCFLRRVENIIQAFNDQQTQTLPDTELDCARLLTILALEDWPTFLAELANHTRAVHTVFESVIGIESPNHQAESELWQALWHSQWSEPEAVEWLSEQAPFWQGADIWRDLQNFQTNITKRSIGQRGREVLDKLVPLLLWHLHHQQAPEKTLTSVLVVFERVVTRTAYLELLFENEGALSHLIKLCQASHWLAQLIAKYPILLDELIDPKLLHNPPALDQYYQDLRVLMLRIPEDDQEAQMDVLRQFKQAQQLRIAAADIAGVLPVMKVSDHLTALAEAALTEVIQLAWQQITARFGIPTSLVGRDDKGFAVLGYGKMGGIELGYHSDLDLVFVHDVDLNDLTNGSKEVPASQFYVKLAQRIMHIFNTKMATGQLYELDMRLRPSGNSGLLTIHIDSFADYQNSEAWTWEHQALVRARTVFGHQDIRQKFADIRQCVLTKTRSSDELKQQVAEMRDKMRTHLDKSNQNTVDLKQGAGGLVDIEFLVQYLVLRHAAQHPEIIEYSDNIRVLSQLVQTQVLTEQQGQLLADGYRYLRDLGHRLALAEADNSVDHYNNEQAASYMVKISEIYKQIIG